MIFFVMPIALEVFSVAELEVDACSLEIMTKRLEWNASWLEKKEVLTIIFKNLLSPYKALFCIFTATSYQVSQLSQKVWGKEREAAVNDNVNDITPSVCPLRLSFATA